MVQDTFTRTLASDWGAADTGETWSAFSVGGTANATDWSVGGGVGRHSVPATIAYRASYVAAFSVADVVVSVTVSVGVLPTGAPLELGNLMLRGTDIFTYYLARAQVETNGKVRALIFDRAGNQLGVATTGLTYTAGMKLRVTAMAVGKTLRIRVSNAAVAEPAAWTLIVVDGGVGAYTGAGWVGVRNGVAEGNTNTLPVVFSVDDVTASVAQLAPFPTAPVTGTIEFAFGADLTADPSTWVYTDCTADWQIDKDLAATIGRADATSRAQPAKLSLWLKNPGGRYTKGNALSSSWPYIRKNTPVRVTLDPGTGSVRQYVMYATQWIPKWGSAGDSDRQPLVQVVANGSRRRLTQGATPLRSALYRKVATGAAIAAWSLEDGSTATTATPTKAGGAPLTPFGSVPADIGSITPLFGKVDGPPGSAELPDFSAKGSLQGQVPTYTDTGQWQVEIWFRTDTGDSSQFSACVPIQLDLIGGTYPAMDVLLFIGQGAGGDGLGTIGFDISPYMASPPTEVYRAGTSGIAPDGPYLILSKIPSVQGAWRQLRVCMRQAGGNVELTAYLDNVLIGSNTAGPATLGRLGRFVLNPTQGVGAYAGVAGSGISSLGHVAFYNTIADPGTYTAGMGYTGETVAARLARLGAEEGIPITVSAGATTAMGPQQPLPFMELADECQEADGGILLDGLSAGFNYLARADAYNLPVALTIDMAGRQFKAPFEPLDADNDLVNDLVVNRRDGASARYVDSTGPAGVSAIGRYDDETTLNVYSDNDLPGQASWRVHLGTAGADALRFPGIGFDLHTKDTQSLIEPWLQAGVRQRAQVTNPPAEYGQGPIDVLVEGYTETVRSRRVWQVAANTSPYDPWRVFVVGTDRVDGDGYQLAAGVSATATTLQVTSTTGLLWVTTATDPGEFPFDIEVAGIRLRVTGISGGTSPQTFTVTRSMDGFDKPLPVNSAVRLWKPVAIAL